MVLGKMKETAESYLNKKVKLVFLHVIPSSSPDCCHLAMLLSQFPHTSMMPNGKQPKMLVK